MKRKPQSKRKDKEDRQAVEIARVLFDDGMNGSVARLQPVSKNGEHINCGAWSRDSVISLILRHLRGAK